MADGFDTELERTIYRAYLEEIVPLIAAIEVYDNEFPAEILNEVRSIFTHFARCRLTDDPAVAADNMEKAERHLKRMRFDCYKYVASMHSIQVGALLDSYSPKVLAGVDDGRFRIEVNRLLRLADETVIRAKTLESEGDEEAALNAYAKATGLYADLVRYVDGSRDALQHAQSLYGSFEEGVDKSGKVGVAVGIVGACIGIVGIAVGVLL